ncbi:unnamed protein product [Albugo candida]|uniref:Uncharacterized protein n=1 Tax=Albugo candida TaxID=65357 RepID=A0A024GQ16_9STRA|nr:unnamed protein product [Albugo candida]|eukprot:CCI48884.1 unnamed protein product [Albugo candida]
MRKRGGNQLIFRELTPVKSVMKYMRTCKPIEVYIVDKDFETSSFHIKRSQEDSLPRQRGCQQHLLNDSSVTTKKILTTCVTSPENAPSLIIICHYEW